MSIAADRIRTGEADIMIAAGTESMSMIPMLGRLAMNPDVFARDENVGIAYGMGLTAEKVAEQWKVSREEQDAFALAIHQQGARRAGRRRIRRARSRPIDVVTTLARSRDRQVVAAHAARSSRDEGPRADTTPEGLAKLKPVFAAQRQRHRGQQLADVRRRGRRRCSSASAC